MAQSSHGDALPADLERLIPVWMAEGGVPGLSIAIVEDAALRWWRPFGVKRAGTSDPITDDTIFEAASLSKPVFAYAVMQLVQRGVLDLDTPLVSYLPPPPERFPFIAEEMEDPHDPRLSLVTARHVLSHSGGFGNFEPGTTHRISFAPGSRFQYASEGYIFLQRVVEHLTGRPLHEHIADQVLQPLGMTASSYVWQDRYEMLAAQGHGERPDDLGSRWTEAWSGWSLYSNPTEYARFCIEMMHTGGGGHPHLDDGPLDEMLRPAIPIDDAISWSLGWGMLHAAAGDAFWQWGDLYTFQHYAIGSRARRNTLIVMTNSDRGLPLCARIAAALWGDEYAIPIEEVLAREW
jgi:CubicO group peptidase (beta-lactamase class C family)